MKSARVVPAAAVLLAMLGTAGVYGADDVTEPHLPRMESTGSLDFYPPAALRDGIEGRVLIAFDITATGHTKNVALVWGENAILNAMALHSVTNYQFAAPADPRSTEAQHRWRMGFVYCIPQSSQPDGFAVSTAAIVYIRGARLPGATVRNKPHAGAATACMKASP